MAPSAIEQQRLDEDGYVILGDFIAPDLLGRFRQRLDQLFAVEGAQAGAEFKQEPGCQRLANLVDKGAVFQEIIALPSLLAYIRHVLGRDIKLPSLNARRVCPHGAGTQPWHTDMAALADAQGFWVCNSVWMLDDFTPSNGTVRLIPGSHRWSQLPQQ